MRWGNCWWYALARWLKNPRESYIIIRVTHVKGSIIHTMFTESIEGIEVEEYHPAVKPPPREQTWARIRWLFSIGFGLCFRGVVRKGTGEDPDPVWR